MVHAHRQGHAGDRHHARLHRGRRRRGRHRRRAAGVHRPRGRAAARGAAAGAQHAGRRRPARPHQDRRQRARSSPPSTWRACWRWAPTGATPRAASCSRWAASRPRPATPATAPPASPRRTRCASAPWWCPTRRSACSTSTQHAARPRRDWWRPPASPTPASCAPHHIVRRVSPSEVQLPLALFPELEPGELLRGEFRPDVRRTGWQMARAGSRDSSRPASMRRRRRSLNRREPRTPARAGLNRASPRQQNAPPEPSVCCTSILTAAIAAMRRACRRPVGMRRAPARLPQEARRPASSAPIHEPAACSTCSCSPRRAASRWPPAYPPDTAAAPAISRAPAAAAARR